jgi:hypothetical protein
VRFDMIFGITIRRVVTQLTGLLPNIDISHLLDAKFCRQRWAFSTSCLKSSSCGRFVSISSTSQEKLYLGKKVPTTPTTSLHHGETPTFIT